MHAVVGLKGITDTQCGFEFLTGDAARETFRRQRVDGYMFDVEILATAAWRWSVTVGERKAAV
jgi:dolichyl-phosphate beta-glucosyltransferase